MKQRRISTSAAAVLTAALLSAFPFSPPASANTVTVGANNTPCDENALRNAILNPPGGTITFSCGLGIVSIPLTQPIAINVDTIVDGGERISLDGGAGMGPAFQVASGVSLSLSGLKIRSFGSGSGNGGAIINQGTLTLNQVALSNNSATAGGAINNAGALIAHNSTLSGNSATNGGAVYNESGGTASFVSSTFSGNSATNGGAFYNGGGTADFDSVTFFGNNGFAFGAGIYNGGSATSILVRNTILAQGAGTQCFGAIVQGGHNLSSDASCGFSGGTNDLINTNPQLGPLQNNGGFTATHLPSPGNPFSPAIDAGDPNCPAADQTGKTRPFGPGCDIGSVENQIPPHVWYVANSGSDSNACNAKSAPCQTINAAIGKAQAGDAVFVRSGTYTIPKSPQGVPVIDVTKSLTISGGWDPNFDMQLKTLSVVDGQKYRRGIQVAAGATATMSRFDVKNGNSGLNGGGAYVLGNLWGIEMVFESNAAQFGAALYVAASPAELTLQDSGVYQNTSFRGGGLFLAGGKAFLQNVTVALNQACLDLTLCGPYGGGGVYVQSGTVKLFSTTIANNRGENSIAQGVYIENTSNGFALLQSTVLDNADFNNVQANCNHAVADLGSNVEEDTNSCGLNSFISRPSSKPALQALQNAGGRSMTMPINNMSAAYDFGAKGGPPEDQRRSSRPQFSGWDAGAYEWDGTTWCKTCSQPISVKVGGIQEISLLIDMPAGAEGSLINPEGQYTRRDSPARAVPLGFPAASFDVRLFGQGAGGSGSVEAPMLTLPMTLTLSFTSETGFGPAQMGEMRFLHFDPAAQAWEELPTMLDPEMQQVSTMTPMLGEFVLALAGDMDGDGIPDPLDNCASAANPGQGDVDLDGVGDDCDCAPLDGLVFAPPGDVTNLDVTDLPGGGLHFSWTDQSPTAGMGTMYDVFSGNVASLRPAGDFAAGSCAFDDLTAPSYDYNGPNPPPGQAMYFMFRAQNSCPGGTGSYGRPSRDATSAQSPTACP